MIKENKPTASKRDEEYKIRVFFGDGKREQVERKARQLEKIYRERRGL